MKRLTALLGCSACLLVIPAVAQTTDRPDAATATTAAKSRDQVDTVIVTGVRDQGYGSKESTSAGKMALDLMKTPQSVQVITGATLLDLQPIFLDDALRSVSGINQTNTFGNTADGVTIRGFQPNAYFRNGIRTLASRSLTPSTERIEILKGPSSLLYGDVEPGGLINIITKRPQFDQRFVSLGYQFSDRGGNRYSLDAGTPLGDVAGGAMAARLVADQDSSDYWRNFGEYDNTFIAPSISWQGERLSLTAAYEYVANDGPFDRGTVVVGDRVAEIPQTRRLGEAFEKLTQTLHIVELQSEYALRDSTTLRVSAAYQDSESDDLQARPRFVTQNAAGQDVLRRRVDGTFGRYEESRYLSASVLQTLTTGALAHQVLLGADHEYGKNGRAGFLVGPDETAEEALVLDNPVYGTLDPTVFTVLPTGPFAGDNTTTGVYLQDVISIGPQWTVLLGGRYERYDSEQRTATIDAATVSDDSTVLPRAGLVYQPQPWVSLYVSYSESFSPNVFTPDSLAPGSPTSFDPERGKSQEVGTKVELGGIQLTTTFFQIDKSNVLEVDNMIPNLIDAAEVHGFEFDVAGEPVAGLSLQGAYAYQDSDDGSGRSLTNVARHTLGITTAYRISGGVMNGLSLGASGQYVDDRDGGANPGASPGGPEFFNVPQYTVIDLFTAYAFETPWAPIRAQLNLRNALDDDYFPSSGGSLRINPGQSRTLYARVSTQF